MVSIFDERSQAGWDSWKREDDPIYILRQVFCKRLEEGTLQEGIHWVAEEIPLTLVINGRNITTVMISPGEEEEFVLGHLLCQGIVSSMDAVEALEVHCGRARVLLTEPIHMDTDWRNGVVRRCGENPSFSGLEGVPKMKSSLKVSPREIFQAMEEVLDSEEHRASGGLHAVGLFSRDGTRIISQDIGRHNALDKAVGRALRLGTPRDSLFVASTSRISSDIALKCARAGFSIVASRGAVTSLALEVGKKAGICLVGFARGEQMNVYTHSWRVGPERRNL